MLVVHLVVYLYYLYAIIPISLSFGGMICGIFTLKIIITLCRMCSMVAKRLILDGW
jgi:hypothetical protein